MPSGAQLGVEAGQGVSGQGPWHIPEAGLHTGRAGSRQPLESTHGGMQMPVMVLQFGLRMLQSSFDEHEP